MYFRIQRQINLEVRPLAKCSSLNNPTTVAIYNSPN